MTPERTPSSGWTEPEKGVHVYPLRVFYEDTDAMGIVYYANHLKFAERARTEMLRLLGTDQSTLMENEGIGFSVRHCEVDYFSPARLDDILEVHSVLLRVGGASLGIGQTIKRGETVLTELGIKVACMTREGRPVRLPDPLRAAFDPYIRQP